MARGMVEVLQPRAGATAGANVEPFARGMNDKKGMPWRHPLRVGLF
jgi:hypothetical protein